MLKKILKKVLTGLAIIIGLLLLYVIMGFLLPYIPVKEEKTSDPKTIDIYIMTNGVHTDIVMPIRNEVKDWSQFVPVTDTKSKSTDFQYLAVGWGDKGFYLDTPTWADLKASTALKAAFWMSESAMHCTYYKNLKEDKDCIKIPVTKAQYQRLVNFVQGKFDENENRQPILIPTNAVYGNNDAFYDAKGSYSFMQTCNTWANDALKSAGQKAALWTPTDTGIFQQYKKD